MERTSQTSDRVRARDAALSLLHRLTTGAASAAVAGVGVFSAVSAATIPGESSSSSSSTQTASSTTSSTSTSSSTSSSSSSGLQSSSGVSSSSGGGMTVTGASH